MARRQASTAAAVSSRVKAVAKSAPKSGAKAGAKAVTQPIAKTARKAARKAEPAKAAAARKAPRAASLVPTDPDEEATAVAALEANQQCAAEGMPLAPGQTHQMVRQPDGTLKPVRRRLSSI